MPDPVLVERNKFASYAKVGATPAYELIGLGFTNLSESKNPKEYSRQYVHEATERTDVTGYAPSIAYSFDMYSDDPVCEHIQNVHDSELTGSAAQIPVCTVNLFDGTAGVYTAWERTYAIIPDSKGDGFDALVYTGTLKAVGDAVKGTFATATNTFTAAAG